MIIIKAEKDGERNWERERKRGLTVYNKQFYISLKNRQIRLYVRRLEGKMIEIVFSSVSVDIKSIIKFTHLYMYLYLMSTE